MSYRRCGSVVGHRYDPLDLIAFPWHLNLWGKDHIRRNLCTTDQFFTGMFPKNHDLAFASPHLTPCRIPQRICVVFRVEWLLRRRAPVNLAECKEFSPTFSTGGLSEIKSP